jgi:hypothetical protein
MKSLLQHNSSTFPKQTKQVRSHDRGVADRNEWMKTSWSCIKYGEVPFLLFSCDVKEVIVTVRRPRLLFVLKLPDSRQGRDH